MVIRVVLTDENAHTENKQMFSYYSECKYIGKLLETLLFKPEKQGDAANNKEDYNDPRVDAQNLWDGYRTHVPPVQKRCIDLLEDLCIQPCAGYHSDDAPKGII